MRELIDAAINKLMEAGENPTDIILNSKNHVTFHDELASAFNTTTDVLMYSKKYYYRGFRVLIDVDVLESHRLSDDDFIIGNYNF